MTDIETLKPLLGTYQVKVLEAIIQRAKNGQIARVTDLNQDTGIGLGNVSNAVKSLMAKNLIKVEIVENNDFGTWKKTKKYLPNI